MFPQFFAYIDPNAGGWLFQLIFPVMIAIAGFWAALRKRVKGLSKQPPAETKDEKTGGK